MRRKAHDEKCVVVATRSRLKMNETVHMMRCFRGIQNRPGAYESGGKPPHSKMTRADFLVGYLSEFVFALLWID